MVDGVFDPVAYLDNPETDSQVGRGKRANMNILEEGGSVE